MHYAQCATVKWMWFVAWIVYVRIASRSLSGVNLNEDFFPK